MNIYKSDTDSSYLFPTIYSETEIVLYCLDKHDDTQCHATLPSLCVTSPKKTIPRACDNVQAVMSSQFYSILTDFMYMNMQKKGLD